MANAHRGEIDVLMGSNTYTLALSLGALAELETAFETDGFEQVLNAMFAKGKPISARTLIKFMTTVMAGCDIDVKDAAVVKDIKSLGTRDTMEVIQKLLDASGLIDASAAPEEPADTAAPLAPVSDPALAGSNG